MLPSIIAVTCSVDEARPHLTLKGSRILEE